MKVNYISINRDKEEEQYDRKINHEIFAQWYRLLLGSSWLIHLTKFYPICLSFFWSVTLH